MPMITLRIDEELNDRLNALASKTDRTKSYYIRRMLEEAISEWEDDLVWFEKKSAEYDAELAKGIKRKYTPLDQVIKKLGLDDVSD